MSKNKLLSKELEVSSVIHLHTDKGSPDGAGKIEDYIKMAKDNGIGYLTCTDHGSTDALLEFYMKLTKAGLTPGLGVEAYLNENRSGDKTEKDVGEDNTNPDDAINNHILLVGKTYKGVQNIIQLNNEAVENGFHRKPRTTTEKIFEYGDDIMISSGCLAGVPARRIINDDTKGCERWLSKYKERFGDDFYIELQINKVPEQIKVNQELVRMSKKLGIKTIIAQDCHYVGESDNIIRILKMIDKRKTTLRDLEEAGGFPDYLTWLNEPTLYIKDNVELIHCAEKWGHDIEKKVLIDSLINNNEWMYKTNIHWDLSKKHYNKFEGFPERFKNADEYFEFLLINGLTSFIEKGYIPSDKVDVYSERLYKEMEILKEKKYVDYLLETKRTIDDVINLVGSDKILGVGRGSAGGSLAVYLLGITRIDPIKHGLIFERFLSDARSNEILDIDI